MGSSSSFYVKVYVYCVLFYPILIPYQLFILTQNIDFSDVPVGPIKTEPDDDFPPFTVKYEDDIEIDEQPIHIKEEV